MKTKREYIQQCLDESMVVLRFADAKAAAKYRLTLYHHRNRAAIRDPRAMDVRLFLKDSTITLIYTPQEPHDVCDIQP